MNISTTKGLAIIIVIAGLVAFFAMQQGSSLVPEQGAQPSVPTTSSGDDSSEDKSIESEDETALVEGPSNDAVCARVHSDVARSDETQIASRGPFALINGEPVGAVEVSGKVSSVEGLYFSDPITELYIAIDPPAKEDALEFYEYYAEMRKNSNSVNGLDGETLNFKLGDFDLDGAISSQADISDAARVVIIDLLNTQELANIRLRFARSQGNGGAPRNFTFACAIEAVLASDEQVRDIDLSVDTSEWITKAFTASVDNISWWSLRMPSQENMSCESGEVFTICFNNFDNGETEWITVYPWGYRPAGSDGYDYPYTCGYDLESCVEQWRNIFSKLDVDKDRMTSSVNGYELLGELSEGDKFQVVILENDEGTAPIIIGKSVFTLNADEIFEAVLATIER